MSHSLVDGRVDRGSRSWRAAGLPLALVALLVCLTPITAPAQVIASGDVYYLGDDIVVAATGTGALTYTLESILEDRGTVVGEVYSGTGTRSGSVAHLSTTMVPRKGLYRLTGTGISARRILLLDHLPVLADPATWPFGLITSDDKISQGAAMAEEMFRVGIRFFHADFAIGTVNAIGSSADPNAGRISAGWEAFLERASALGLQPIIKLMTSYSDISQPTNLNGPFYTGLRRIQTYYRGKLKHWMIANEVEGGFYSLFTVDQYANSVRNMSQVLKGVDPGVTMIAGEFYDASNQYLDRLIEPAYRDSWDALSVHAVIRGGFGNSYLSQYISNLGGLSKPVWETESYGAVYGGPSHREQDLRSNFPVLESVDYYSGIAKLMLRSFCLESRSGNTWVPAVHAPATPCLGVQRFISMHYNANWETLWALKRHFVTDTQAVEELNEKVVTYRAAADFLYGATGLTRIPATGGNYSRADGYIYQQGAEYIVALWQNTNQASMARELVLGTDDAITMLDSFGNPYPLRNAGGQVKVWVPQDVVYLRGFRSIPSITLDTTSSDAPYFLTAAPTRGVVGRPYYYAARAYDSDVASTGTNSIPRITYSLVSGPAGMTVSRGGDARAFLLTWTPQSPGSYDVVIRATSTHGATQTVDQSFTLTVEPSGSNVAPYIHSAPMTSVARPSYVWRYNVNAHDPNGDRVTYAVAGLPGATIDPTSGFIQWTPQASGQHAVTVSATDPGGLSATQSFTVSVGSGGGGASPSAPTNVRITVR